MAVWVPEPYSLNGVELLSRQWRSITIQTEQINMGIGPKNHSSKLRAKYSALSPSDQSSPPLMTDDSTLLADTSLLGLLIK